MVSKIDYVYEMDKSNEAKLIGAKVATIDGYAVKSFKYYVGLSLNINDVINNTSIQEKLGVRNIASFERNYYAANAVGIVYFPQTGSYGFLGKSDTVIDYSEDKSVEESLDIVVAPFREMEVSSEEFKEQIENTFELDDPMVEFYDLPYTRTRISTK
ncbi:MAG TPA: hypothetical protein IAB65_04350 [Candidatus Onthocola stercorigallinarum]|nr:hypothetical protein [Candidatus Onthocola stercorigallinarum]